MPEMTTPTVPKPQMWLGLMWLGLSALVVLSGLCAIFASVVTLAEAWGEYAQARWPEVTALVDNCKLKRTSSNGGRKFHIQCRLIYSVGAEQNATLHLESIRFTTPLSEAMKPYDTFARAGETNALKVAMSAMV